MTGLPALLFLWLGQTTGHIFTILSKFPGMAWWCSQKSMTVVAWVVALGAWIYSQVFLRPLDFKLVRREDFDKLII